MNNSTKKYVDNKNINNMTEKIKDGLRTSKRYYIAIKESIRNTPQRVRFFNVGISLIFLFIFTRIYFNLTLSIIFAILSFLSIFIFLNNKFLAVLLLIIYIVIIVNKTSAVSAYIGSPILQTDIVKNGSPYDCTTGSLAISNNDLAQELSGGSYSYSFWFYVNGNDNNYNTNNNNNNHYWEGYKYNDWKSIFYRGNALTSDNLSTLIQFPGFWLTPLYNNLVIVFQNSTNVERIEIENIEFNSWINVALVIENNSVLIYINGLLSKTLNLYQSSINMNNYNLYITNDASLTKDKLPGFAGYLAELMTYNYAIPQSQIYNSYQYYKKIIDKYQNNKNIQSNTYQLPSLITNSDYMKT
jgi:hypothetical protein